MVVSTTPEGSTFKPMTEAAKEVAKFLRQEYAKTPITKPELVQTMDSSKIIEGPSPSGSAVEKKVANLASLKLETVETKNLPVLSISEVLLSEFSNEEFRNVLSFKASSFISDQTQSSFNFEIKGVRAIWDPSLSIPGTNRRGGFRCPVGTRYGGQITDRFGRSCGWGVARRIANQIADIGERLEQRDDDKRKRRLDRRNARMMRRLGGTPETGRVEGGLRGIADRLEGGAKPRQRRGGPGFAELGNRIADDMRPGSVLDRVVNGNGGRERSEDVLPEAGAPSARRPQNRRRDVIPETAPTPASTPRPARRPAPAGQRRPQPRPRVAPQAENVDVLTAREASDASATEGFSPYVLRKYDEYAKRVREIRAGGGNAGMLTRREWYAINKPNLRDAWKDAHGRSAPQDFEPPTPQARRPRNNRGRRKKATTAGAARSASRKPQADDVPEPAPARPVRPAQPARRPRRSPDGRGFVTPGNGGAPAPAPPTPPEPPTPRTPPQKPARRRGTNAPELKMNNLADHHASSMPKLQPDDGKFVAVAVGNKGINTLAQAKQYQGSLADIPDEFILGVIQSRTYKPGGPMSPRVVEAVKSVYPSADDVEVLSIMRALGQNLRRSLNQPPPAMEQDVKDLVKALKDANVEFIQIPVGNGITAPQYYFHLLEDEKKWGRGYFLKKPDISGESQMFAGKKVSQHAELIGNILAKELGFANGTPRLAKGTGDNPFLLMDIFVNNAEGKVAGRYNPQRVTDPKSRLFNGFLNAVMDVADRHPGNGDQFVGNGAVPLDFGRAKFMKKTATQQMQYLSNLMMDSRPWDGYKTRLTGKVGAAKTREVNAIRSELQADIEKASEKMRNALTKVDQVNIAYGAVEDVVKANRKTNLAYNIEQFASPEFLDLLMQKISV